jgi:phosphoglucomutase
MISHLKTLIGPEKSSFIGKSFKKFVVKECDDFSYADPIDGSVSKGQGLRIIFEDTSRLIFRLSGTGSLGATIRLYIEKFEPNSAMFSEEASVVLKPLIEVALEISKLQHFTGRTEPTVIT